MSRPDEAPRRRRWPRRLAIGAAALLLAAVAGWYAVPEYRPPLRDGERYGVDVSRHQGEIDWDRVAADDIDFAYIKATEGGDHVDERFAPNWEAAGRAGIDRGGYHFFTLCRPGGEQARHFLDHLPADAELPPAVDLELAGNCSRRPRSEEVERQVRMFVELVEAEVGDELILYVGDDFHGRYGLRDELECDLWQLRVLRRPSQDRWVVWQVHGWAHVEGIGGRVDLDIMRTR